MNARSRIEYLIKALAALALCVSLLYVWLILVVPWLKFFSTPQTDAIGTTVIIIMPILMGLPGFFGLYFGWRGVGRCDAATVKGLVGTYCFGVTWFLGVSLGAWAFPGPEDAARNFLFLGTGVGAVGLYLLVSRWLLRRLGFDCPSLRRSLPTWMILILAFLLWTALMGLVRTDSPVGSGESLISIASFFGATALAVGAFRLGVWLFVKQQTTKEARDSAE